MILSHLPKSSLIAMMKTYSIILEYTNCNKEIILNFYNNCKLELNKRQNE